MPGIASDKHSTPSESISQFVAQVISEPLALLCSHSPVECEICQRDESGWASSQIINSDKGRSSRSGSSREGSLRHRLLYIHAAADLYGSPTIAQLLEDNSARTSVVFSSLHDFQEFKRTSSKNQPRRIGFVPLPALSAGPSSCEGPIILAARTVEEDHARQQLRALKILKGKVPNALWFVSKEELAQAQCLAKAEEVEDSVSVVAPRTQMALEEVFNEASVYIHLRFSAICPAGVYLPQALARGVPSIVLDFAETSYFPPPVTLKILPGYPEVEELVGALSSLFNPANGLSKRRQLGSAAMAFADEFLSPAVVIQALSDYLICE